MSKRSIILGIVELWRLYQFIKYVKKHPSIEYVKLLSDYGGQATELWDIAIKDGYLSVDDGVHPRLTFKGRQLTEMRGYGFVVQAIKMYGGPLVLLAGIASIINLIVIIVRHQ